MEKYLGVKIVEAEPCFGRNNKCVPENSEFDGTEINGYKVVYEDGYVSWSPKEVFEKAYRNLNLNHGVDVDIIVDTSSGSWVYSTNDLHKGDS